METIRNLTFIMAFSYLVMLTLYFAYDLSIASHHRLGRFFSHRIENLDDQDVTDSIAVANPEQLEKHTSIVVDKTMGLEGYVVAKMRRKTDILQFWMAKNKELYSDLQEKLVFLDYALIREQPEFLKASELQKGVTLHLENCSEKGMDESPLYLRFDGRELKKISIENFSKLSLIQ